MKIIPQAKPLISDNEIKAVSDVLKSGHLAMGPVCLKLEKLWQEMICMESAITVGSGLAALRLSLHALDVGVGDEVIIPAYSCVALPNAVMSLGATPVLADIEQGTWNLSPYEAEKKVTKNTKAIIVTHMFGSPGDIAGLKKLNVPIIEDCAHGIGGRCDGKPFGGAGDVSMASFYATKMICAGEGGIVASNDPEITRRIKTAREYSNQEPSGIHLNDKMTDIEAAIAIEQLKGLEYNLKLREQLASSYDGLLASVAESIDIELPAQIPGRIWYRYIIRLNNNNAEDVCSRMQSKNIHATQPVWDLRGTRIWVEEYVNTSLAFGSLVSLPLYPGLEPGDTDRVVECLETCCK